jgi:hypothetical protein
MFLEATQTSSIMIQLFFVMFQSPLDAQDDPKRGPRRAQRGPRGSQDNPKEALNMPQEATQTSCIMIQLFFVMFQSPLDAQDDPKRGPRRAQRGPRGPQDNHKEALNMPQKATQTSCIMIQLLFFRLSFIELFHLCFQLCLRFVFHIVPISFPIICPKIVCMQFLHFPCSIAFRGL